MHGFEELKFWEVGEDEKPFYAGEDSNVRSNTWHTVGKYLLQKYKLEQ